MIAYGKRHCTPDANECGVCFSFSFAPIRRKVATSDLRVGSVTADLMTALMLGRRDERVEFGLPLARNELSLALLRESLRYFCAGFWWNAEWAIVPGARIRKLVPRSRSRNLLNLLERRSDRRWRAFHKSSKRVHDGEPHHWSPN